MAEVDSIVSTLFQTVSQILINETKIILNASADLESLQGDLKFMQEFLRRSEGEGEVKEDMKQFRVAVLEAENLIDDFIIKMAKHKRRNRLLRFSHGGELIILLKNVAAKVKLIRNKIDRILENRKKFNITSDKGEASKRSIILRHRRNVEMEDVVRFDNDAKLVIEKLDTQDLRRDVVSIIGTGGLGKTTLAMKIFTGDFAKNFDCAAWVDVSQDYNLKDLLKKIANAVLPSTEMEEFNRLDLLHKANECSSEEGKKKLVQMLKDGLAGRRYFIVLDDVWETLLWDEIKAALPENNKSSRVLVTSRVKEVVLHTSTRTPPYLLPFLDENGSWELFSRKVFHDQVCPPKLEELVRQQILTKCKGLPLAIVVVAGLLRKREESLWSKVADNLNWHISLDQNECLGILALSYEELPPHLKRCFLYFGVFPEDFEISVTRLIRLWVAEGFVDEDNDSTCDMEDMAEEYLLELIDRSLIQVARKRKDGRVKSCRIHDLLRDLSISEGKREMFLSVDRKLDGSFDTPPRRLSVHYGSRELRYNYLSELSQLRSLVIFGDEEDDYSFSQVAPDKDPFSHLSKFCRYVRVLDFGSGRLSNFSPKVEKLTQLRYLRIGTRIIHEIPSSIYTQTIDIRKVLEFAPNFRFNLWEMRQLRHLLLSEYNRYSIPKGNHITELVNLHTLSGFSIHCSADADILKMFPNLKKLKVDCFERKLDVFQYLTKLQRLQTLKICGMFEFTDPSALPLSLTSITLMDSFLDTSAFSKLGGLPNLQVLKLITFFNMLERKLENGSDQRQFPSLKVLIIMKSPNIEYWSMEGQGLQSLIHLSILECYKLKAIPEQLKQLSNLSQLKVIWLPSS